jgi:hypothetical protein
MANLIKKDKLYTMAKKNQRQTILIGVRHRIWASREDAKPYLKHKTRYRLTLLIPEIIIMFSTPPVYFYPPLEYVVSASLEIGISNLLIRRIKKLTMSCQGSLDGAPELNFLLDDGNNIYSYKSQLGSLTAIRSESYFYVKERKQSLEPLVNPSPVEEYYKCPIENGEVNKAVIVAITKDIFDGVLNEVPTSIRNLLSIREENTTSYIETISSTSTPRLT